jgi:hypothetical protein
MDDLNKPVVSIRWPAWQYVLRGLILVALSAYCGAMVIFMIRDAAMAGAGNNPHAAAFRYEFWVPVFVTSVLCVLPLIGLVFVIKRPMFEVGRNGMTLEKIRVRWDQVLYCHWGQHEPGVLNVQIHHGRQFVRVPEPRRAEVEKALSAYGKWQLE